MTGRGAGKTFPEAKAEWERRAREALGGPVRFAVARAPLSRSALTTGERRRLAEIRHPGRRRDWLRGRRALKELLRSLGLPEDTSRIDFPHPRLSLAHSAGWAVAAGWDGKAEPAGLGVDFEGHRPLRAGASRFFLNREERGARGGKGLLRLWTVKEALFKSDPGNADPAPGRSSLRRYVLERPFSASSGGARRADAPAPLRFRYFSLELREGFLAMALCRAGRTTDRTYRRRAASRAQASA